MVKIVFAALVVAFAVLGCAQAAMQEVPANTRRDDVVAGMSKEEINAEIRKAMPLPVLRILSWKELGIRKWVVEMSTTPLVAPKTPAVHVRFETRDENGREELQEAFANAAEYTKGLMALAVDG